jgi:hypothetical protein
VELLHIRWVRTWQPSADPVLAFAGEELARYMRKLTGRTLDVLGVREVTGRADAIWLGVCDQMPLPPGAGLEAAPWDDGYALWNSDAGLYVAGRNARSVLFGVYAFLEQQGVRYLRPGYEGEVVPRVEELWLPGSEPQSAVVEQARYRHRGVCIEGAPSIAHALEMVDWCAKKRMNTVFLQFLSSRYFYNLWYERAYNAEHADRSVSEAEALALDDQVIASLKKRGLVLHRVGHGWTSAAFGMPRSGWVTAGEEVPPQYVRWLAEVDGERALFQDIPINTELCYSHGPAFDAFVETIVAYCEQHPELDVVHVWLSDATNNKCECPGCRELSISDWYVKVINALSAELRQRAPRMRFVFLAYIELLWAPEELEIDAGAVGTPESEGNAILMYAPIRRCYGHSLDDPDCDDGAPWPRPPLNEYSASAYNAFYVQRLADWRKAFGGDSFDYDYHLMWAIWQQMTDTRIARLFHEDLQQLQALGLNGIVSCQSFRVFYPSGLAMTALAESLWDPDVPWEQMRRRYLSAAFGEDAALADRYLTIIEGFLDTGDPHARTVPLSNASEVSLAACARFLDESLAELEERREATPVRARKKSLDLLAYHARLLQHVVRAYQARLAKDEEEAVRAFGEAARFLRRTEPQYSTYIDTMLALRYLERARQQA